jgi:hypothetical protein
MGFSEGKTGGLQASWAIQFARSAPALQMFQRPLAEFRNSHVPVLI